MKNGAWQSHDAACECAGCAHDRAFMQLTSEMLEELEPTPPSRVWPVIKEALCWIAAIGFVLVLVRCGQ